MKAEVIVVRDSAEADLPRITEIYGRSVREETASFELEPPSLEEMARRRAALLEAGYPYLVATVGCRVEGYAYAGPFRSRPAYRFTVENSVYIDPSAQRSGLGRALMQRLIAECEARGYRQMIAIIGGSEHVASIEFHRALGFADAGVFRSVGYKNGRWLDTVHLQLALGPGDAGPELRGQFT